MRRSRPPVRCPKPWNGWNAPAVSYTPSTNSGVAPTCCSDRHATKLREAGFDDLAENLDTEMVGRNVLFGRWTFQIVEDFDDNYWDPFRQHERHVRQVIQQGVRHVLEAEMKECRRTHGHPGHEPRPS